VARGAVAGVGRKIGVGKESDVYEVRTSGGGGGGGGGADALPDR
jgi:RIO-like serine/threonine protein kinase